MGLILKKKFKPDEGFKLPVNVLFPNSWNMNEIPKDKYLKLKNFIKECRETKGKTPVPVIVRPGRKKGRYEIIDGEHRWRATKELGYKDVDSYIYECDDRTARLLTNSLNYLKGSPNPAKEANYIQDLITTGVSLDDIVSHTDYTQDRLDDLILTAGIEVEDVDLSDKEAPDVEVKPLEAWTDIKFTVPVAVAEIVEAEIARIATVLEGKGIRGRALEFMAVNSANTPLPIDPSRIYRSALAKKLKLRAKKP